MLKLGLSLFIKEAILFALTLGLGLYTAYYYLLNAGEFTQESSVSFTLADFVILVILFGVIFLISRHRRIAHFSFKIFLILIVFSGSQVVFGTFIPSLWNTLAALVFAFLFARGGNVMMHNLGIILGIGGIAAVFGLSITVEFGLLLLVALSLYDIFAVYVTKHMVAMARSMVEGGAIFGFLIPFKFKGFFYGREQAKTGIGNDFMILGSGDIGLPLIFVSSLVKFSLTSAIITACFSLIGLFLTHLLFTNQTQRRVMAALPPIATMTIIGYLVSLLV